MSVNALLELCNHPEKLATAAQSPSLTINYVPNTHYYTEIYLMTLHPHHYSPVTNLN